MTEPTTMTPRMLGEQIAIDGALLALAAKAIGATEYGGPDDCRGPGIVLLRGQPMHYEGAGEFGYAWAPLYDDGDALSLVSAAGIVVIKRTDTIDGPHIDAGYTLPSNPNWICYRGAPIGDDEPAAWRRAIVLAAAAIGEAMP